MNDISRLHHRVRDKLSVAITEADGNEVLAVAKSDNEGLIIDLDIVARGDTEQVPALDPYIEKGDVIIHNHPSGLLRPSKADLAIASKIGNQGVGFIIVNNTVDSLYIVAEPILRQEKQTISSEELVSILAPGGRLSRLVQFYEPRNVQMEMLEAVVDALNEDLITVAEAGTGVGKSLAYLLPAFRWAEKNNERVVISTATINLQQQLVEKDIPLVKELLGSEVSYVLVKGRGNYICLRRLAERLEENTLFREEDDDLSSLAEWVKSSPTGNRTDIGFYVEDRLWSSVNSEADTCLGLRCPRREQCYVLKARREAAAAQVLVSNHHLLFSDLAMRLEGAGYENSAVLPPFQRVIFDEAHNIESSATSFFSESFSKGTVSKQLNRLYRKKKNRVYGLVLRLQSIIGTNDYLSKIPSSIERVREQCDGVENAILSFIESSSALRLTKNTPKGILHLLQEQLSELHARLIDLIHALASSIENFTFKENDLPIVYEVETVRTALEHVGSICSRFNVFDEHPRSVFWLERVGRRTENRFVRFTISPLDIAPLMREALYERYGTIACTSATLTVKESFAYWSRRIGLDTAEEQSVNYNIFPSPFPYRDNVLLAVPEDAPTPEKPEYQDFISLLVTKTLLLTEGRGLVLFTSYDMLEKTYTAVKPELEREQITSFKQGNSDRAALLRNFTKDIASVLFATASFWEGIDAPGETLKIVIICRLPFKVPTGPIIQARMEAIEARGGNSFMELALPEAVMKLKQGFGRLMRRYTDRGVILILDSRIIAKSYGRYFLESLPETRRSIKKDRFLLEEIESFLYSQ